MSSYQSDEEQFEALQKWWKENGRALVAGVVVAVLLVLGWDAWKQQQAKTRAEAAMAYQNLLDTAGNPGAELDEVAYTTAQHLVGQLKEKASGSAYATYAALLMARIDIDRNQPEAALASLQWAEAHAADDTLAQLAQLRIAEVQFALGKTDEALATLNALSTDSYLTPLVLQLKGDIHVSRDERQQALDAYQAAMDWLQANDKAPIRLLEVKRDALQVADDAVTVPLASAGQS